MTRGQLTPSVPVLGNNGRKGKSSTFGRLDGDVLVKHIRACNILRVPERSFTIDKALADSLRGQFRSVRVLVAEESTQYELTASEFWELAEAYDYGNGEGYRVACRFWHSAGQLPLQSEVKG